MDSRVTVPLSPEVSSTSPEATCALLRPQAVLFDMDGTLLDSEGMWFACQREEFARYGLDWKIEDQNLMIGKTIVSGSQEVIDRFRLNADAAEVGANIASRVLDMVVRDGVVWRPGAYELVQRLDSWGVPMALVTSSYASYAQRVADLAPGKGFSYLVTGDMVVRGKPDPEPYLLAARKLGLDPAQCVAFEDSYAGVLSAYHAGTIAVAVPFQTDIPELDSLTILDSLENATAEWFDALLRARSGSLSSVSVSHC